MACIVMRVCSSSSRLTSSNVLGRKVIDELLVNRNVLLLSKNSRVELDLVLVKDLLGDVGRDVEQRIAYGA